MGFQKSNDLTNRALCLFCFFLKNFVYQFDKLRINILVKYCNTRIKTFVKTFISAFKASKLSYIHLAYFATAATGFASLCAQVAWQKYLTILVGSDTRSINLVIAVFLLGLAVGYYVFGKITERSWSRFLLLKVYAWIEMATAVYIAVFYVYFEFLKSVSFNTPSYLIIDILIALLALFLPTFLMGASIPVLTAVLPKSSNEINACHFKVYGWNAFGAFLGVLFSGFYLLPVFGLALTLVIAGVINFISALIFMGNKLKGGLRRQTEYSVIPSKIPNWFYIFFSFLAGAIIISFEVLFIRLLHLSVGAGVFNFPIILSLFVGGLAWGSLSVNSQKASPAFFIRQTLITAFLLGLLFILSPYWSIWISHIRVSLLSIPSNYFVFKFVLYLFSALFLLPAVFFMGRLLPLSYALLKKTKENYGAVCGYLYFFNTVGTVFGAVILAYLAFYIFALDELFKINLFLLTALAFISALYEKRIFSATAAVCLAVFLLLLPNWSRTGHYHGYFRTTLPKYYHFQKMFFIPNQNEQEKLLFFEDGPNVSISLVAFPKSPDSSEEKQLFPSTEYQSTSFFVNGKAIGNSIGDFSTVFLLASTAYLYAPERSQLSSAVIGLGMGSTAGFLAKLDEISDTTVLEIAPEVVENVKRSPDFSFGLLDNPKAKVIAQDGFKYFTKTDKKFDIIVSEPSNPWVVGVENVFTYEFYELAKETLADDGVLVQWAQLYSIDSDSLRLMFHTLKKVFPYAKVYRVGLADIAIVASSSPLKPKFSLGRFSNSFLKPYYSAIGFYEPEDLILAQIFSEEVFSELAKSKSFGLHTLTMPKLAYRGDKTFFLNQGIQVEKLAPDYFSESSGVTGEKIKAFQKYVSMDKETIKERCLLPQIGFFCNLLINIQANKKAFEDTSKSLLFRMNSYIYLRKQGMINYQEQYLEDLKKEIIEKKYKNYVVFLNYLNQLLSDRRYKQARDDLRFFQKEELLNEDSFSQLEDYISEVEGELELSL